MTNMIKKLTATLLLSGVVATAQAAMVSDGVTDSTLASAFTVGHITVHDLQRIQQATLESYLPIKVGDKIDGDISSEVIDDLYKSGFFSNVTLTRQGDTLDINVVERPIVGNILLRGNQSIERKDLMKALNDAGIANGAEYNPFFVDEIRGVLLDQYLMQGKYSARVHTEVEHMANNRVVLNINIAEGKELKVKKITILGNHAFTEKMLVKQFKLTPPGLTTMFSKDDVYASKKLADDLQRLHFFYLDHGYLKYQQISKQAGLTPNRRQVYITVHIHEGAQYRLSGYKFSGKTILTQTELYKMSTLKTGELFSRKNLVDLQKKIITALNEKGYANATINVTPKIDDKTHRVFLTLEIIPSQRIYIRHITFSGNYQTNDRVLRRHVVQQEGALSSAQKIHAESVHNLHMLPYVRQIEVNATPVAGHPNEEDINYKVTEMPAAAFTIQGGFSSSNGPTYGASLNQKNFLGTGNTLGLSFNRDRVQTGYNIDYFNPYFTASGIGQDLNLFYQTYDTSYLDTAEYSTDNAGFMLQYTFRASPRSRYHLGFGYTNTRLGIGSNPSTQLQDFVAKHGKRFYQPLITAGWTYSTLDRYLFPTKGWHENLNFSVTVPVAEDSLRYYKTSYMATYYHPLYHRSWVLHLRGAMGYSNGYGSYAGENPFFQNFFAGGMDGLGAVHGFEAGSLGPVDSQGNALGGNVLLTGSAGIVFPNPLGKNVRTTWFVDGGNVFSTSGDGSQPHDLGIRGFAFDEIRYSTGVQLDWYTPFGATLELAIAEVLSDKEGDATKFVDFTIGAGL
ncbi:MAG: outer membrane protein assembly factor BamA [Gammaproteobacteria bacterium]|nr:outer membrane protein assembly factor BamA [Gammaproteobacteria bacterium]